MMYVMKKLIIVIEVSLSVCHYLRKHCGAFCDYGLRLLLCAWCSLLCWTHLAGARDQYEVTRTLYSGNRLIEHPQE